MKVARKVPSTTWLMVSRMKRVISLGPSWLAASVSVTSVIENTRLATVTIELAIVASTCRAPSGPIRSIPFSGSNHLGGSVLSR
jgi:hypothetical protein